MPRFLLLLLLFMLSCAGPTSLGEPVPSELKPTDPCLETPDPSGWIRDGVISALEDQLVHLCACFREDAEGVKLYVAAYVHVDGSVRVDLLGHRSTVADQIDCFARRTGKAIENWVDLGGGWFEPDLYLDAPAMVYTWDGVSCPSSDADLPISGPLLSQGYLQTNPDGILFPNEMPQKSCFDRVRRHVRLNFTMEVRPPPPACENAWHPMGCPPEEAGDE